MFCSNKVTYDINEEDCRGGYFDDDLIRDEMCSPSGKVKVM